ncbi:uncharacterized protein EHS24_005446 [Apiotrichum porosum]|uniref:N-acetyltransferase domain-containing protein n=1 Tax=Apiotrichum porosum TaxID=105984 RepID=A0A427XCZ0_9TREE|nr:uncharacterized protein EHS24_005446 [Apiotrichum porosum]RSH76698.1 hypothetical protein EHS24_005446 [Apiotrichum porosum]
MPPRTQVVIRPIPATSTSLLRHTVLWPSIPLAAQLLPYDHEPTTAHLGAFLPVPPANFGLHDVPNDYSPGALDPQPVGCLTVVFEEYLGALPNDIKARGPIRQQVQLHKFAVLQQLQGQRIGRRLIERALADLASLDAGRILFHFDARLDQIGFYERLGMRILDPRVFIKYGPTGDGPPIEHIRMGKIID